MQNLRRKNESGRSMVEMLGVLAIIGVLSVGGVYGYGVAMKKHKANELLHQASMLATTISAQIQSKGELPQSIEDFGNGKYGTFKKPEKANDEQFKMEITDMDSAVCEQMETMAGGMVRKAECNDSTLTLTYNNNLSSEAVPAEFDGDQSACEADSTRQYCEARGECIKSTEKCLVEPKLICQGNSVLQDGVCVCQNGVPYKADYYNRGDGACDGAEMSGCINNQSCLSGEFCLIECNASYKTEIPDSCTGTCKSLSKYPGLEVEYDGHTYVKLDEVSAWTAQNYCKAKGLPQATFDDFGVLSNDTCSVEVDCICKKDGCDCVDGLEEKFGSYFALWLSNYTSFGALGCEWPDAMSEHVFSNTFTAVCKVK